MNIFPFFGLFQDYSNFFNEIGVTWFLIGIGITVGTIISIIPQISKIIARRSSYGLSSITIFFTSIGQFSVFVNLLCFNYEEFIGFFQFSLTKTFPSFLTFLNVSLLWATYLFVVFLQIVFRTEQVKIPKLNPNFHYEFRKLGKFGMRLGAIFSTFFIVFFSFALLYIYFYIGTHFGFGSEKIQIYGALLGTISSVIVFAQYLPQILTTLKLKNSGSLSLLMLEIQAPGGAINALFMWLGQRNHWSTWISYVLSSFQQFILLFICLYYDKINQPDTSSRSSHHSIQDELDDEIALTDRLPDNYVLPILHAIEEHEQM